MSEILLGPEGGLFRRLRGACLDDWYGYTRHDFVTRLAAGTLPEESFRHYLIQDYLFLIQFARAYALAAYKADDVADIRQAAKSLSTAKRTRCSSPRPSLIWTRHNRSRGVIRPMVSVSTATGPSARTPAGRSSSWKCTAIGVGP